MSADALITMFAAFSKVGTDVDNVHSCLVIICLCRFSWRIFPLGHDAGPLSWIHGGPCLEFQHGMSRMGLKEKSERFGSYSLVSIPISLPSGSVTITVMLQPISLPIPKTFFFPTFRSVCSFA